MSMEENKKKRVSVLDLGQIYMLSLTLTQKRCLGQFYHLLELTCSRANPNK